MRIAACGHTMKAILFCILLLWTVAGCRRGNPEDDAALTAAPPPAAAMAPTGESVQLDDRLAQLDRQLQVMLKREVDDGTEARMLRAEALTDRLLEADPPVEWLASDYSLDARLRQLQALADRIVAAMRRDAAADSIRSDMRDLQRRVALLRRELAQPGGGAAPPSLDSLLAAVRMDAPMAAEGPGGE